MRIIQGLFVSTRVANASRSPRRSPARSSASSAVLRACGSPIAACMVVRTPRTQRYSFRFSQKSTQSRKGGEGSALHRSYRHPQPIGELGLRQPTVVRELEHIALLARELGERVAHAPPLRARDGSLLG